MQISGIFAPWSSISMKFVKPRDPEFSATRETSVPLWMSSNRGVLAGRL